MRNAAVFASAVLLAITDTRYMYLIVKKRVSPAIATWVMFEVTVLVSFFTYLASETPNIVSNITNTVDVVAVTLILATLACAGERKEWRFDRFDIWCLAGSGAILVLWGVTADAFAANMAIQAIMTIAYVPTFRRLLALRKNTESFPTWIAIWASAGIAFGIGKADANTLAMVYSGRAFVMITMLLILMSLLEFKNKK